MPFVILLAVLIIVPIIFGVMRTGSKVRKFQKLGDIRGMQMKDIIRKVGMPTSISASTNGGQLYQWIGTSGRSGYHYAIVSDGQGGAVGYTHQFVR
ncbi:hypothetical protein WBP06_09490 [Novosphingobium sp. BL-8H]|uniref:hypothetical protein n=1 Tax=Novosphingobium sp. BL-8H TaxID=3127640 RepID=UPI00375658D2